MENNLEIVGLYKSYPSFRLENVDLQLPYGRIMGLAGENGAGKTTLLKLILNGTDRDSEYFDMLADRFQIPQKKEIRKFSKGMKAKLNIAAALSIHPKLLLMDEQTAGLDPVMRDELLTFCRAYVEKENASILFSSHITSDIEKIAVERKR